MTAVRHTKEKLFGKGDGKGKRVTIDVFQGSASKLGAARRSIGLLASTTDTNTPVQIARRQFDPVELEVRPRRRPTNRGTPSESVHQAIGKAPMSR